MRETAPLDMAALISEMDLSELRALEMAVTVAIRLRTQGQLSSDTWERPAAEDGGSTLAQQAGHILQQVDEYELTLADQALLAALILSVEYQQESFSSRDINDVIEENGRPRVAHITSAIAGLFSRSYLVGTSKELSLSLEGKKKARALIGIIRRKKAS